jgi:hypothetical protein
MEAEMKKKNFVFQTKGPCLLTDRKQTYFVLANFQKNPSNGTRGTTEILLRSPTPLQAYVA